MSDKPLTIAVLAMGGQGGGVLTDWIVALAEGQGWHAQSTSVPGVAQRTGATLYYIEMLPARDGAAPVLALMPSPGDVGVVLAAEWMEAGRSILRGLMTPERTVLIASTHRAYAVAEKEKPGHGIADPQAVTAAAAIAARRVISFDMNAIAARHGSVISAPLFGALAAADVLPFPRAAFEAVVRAGGRGIEPSLKAFAEGFEQALAPPVPQATPGKRFADLPVSAGHPALDGLLATIRREFDPALHAMLFAGLRHLTDFQDADYAAEYLERIARFRRLDDAARGWRLTLTAAKHLAAAMAYDDVIAVADRKTRASRFARVRGEMQAADQQILYTTEFMHPRAEELVGLLPRRLGAWVEARPSLFARIDRLVSRGRRVRTGTVGWFLALYAMAGLRRWRRGTLRHGREMADITAWLDLAAGQAYPLAIEVVAARRLVKGYSGTMARSQSKFARVLGALPLLQGRDDGGDWLRRLVAFALQDEDGKALDDALKTVAQL